MYRNVRPRHFDSPPDCTEKPLEKSSMRSFEIDTTTSGGKAMFQMMGVFAEFERSIIQERVRAGPRRAKQEGKQLGRPRIAPELEARILAALKVPGRTEGVRKIAKRFGVDPSTVQRISRPFGGVSEAA